MDLIISLRGTALSADESAWVLAEYQHEIFEGFRYKLFDIGRLLIRSDLKNYKNEAWRNEVTQLHEEAIDMVRKPWAHPEGFPGSLHYLDSRLKDLGLSVFDSDQHETFLRLFNRASQECQASLACRLSLNGAAHHLPDFEWRSDCGRDGEEYVFQVFYEQTEAIALYGRGCWKRHTGLVWRAPYYMQPASAAELREIEGRFIAASIGQTAPA